MQTIFMSLLAAGLIILGAGFFTLKREVDNLKSQPLPSPRQIVFSDDTSEPSIVYQDTDDSSQQISDLKNYIDSSIATLSGKQTTSVVYKESAPTAKTPQTSFITLGSTFTTTSTDWTDVSDSAVYIDLANDYSSDAKVTFEASLKVANGNGQAFARLWDDTNKIAVVGSEISTTNNPDFKQVISGNLALWRGRNLYKVQVKSLNSFVVTISSSRVKISY